MHTCMGVCIYIYICVCICECVFVYKYSGVSLSRTPKGPDKKFEIANFEIAGRHQGEVRHSEILKFFKFRFRSGKIKDIKTEGLRIKYSQRIRK